MAKTKKSLSKPAQKLLERIHNPHRYYKPLWYPGATKGKYMQELIAAGFVVCKQDASGTWRMVPSGFRFVGRWRNGDYGFDHWPKRYYAPTKPLEPGHYNMTLESMRKRGDKIIVNAIAEVPDGKQRIKFGIKR